MTDGRWRGSEWSAGGDWRTMRDGIGLQRVPGGNKVILSLRGIKTNPWGKPNPRTECLKNSNETMYLALGVDQAGKDTMGLISITFKKPTPKHPATTITPTNSRHPDRGEDEPVIIEQDGVVMYDLETLSTAQYMVVSTGIGESNFWLRWIVATARDAGMVDCVACAAARPLLITTPLNMALSDHGGLWCIIRMYLERHPTNCTTLSTLFPPGLNDTVTPVFAAAKGEYFCFQRNGTAPVGNLPPAWCNHTLNVTAWTTRLSGGSPEPTCFGYAGAERF